MRRRAAAAFRLRQAERSGQQKGAGHVAPQQQAPAPAPPLSSCRPCSRLPASACRCCSSPPLAFTTHPLTFFPSLPFHLLARILLDAALNRRPALGVACPPSRRPQSARSVLPPPLLLRRCSPPSTTRVEEMQIGGKPRALPLPYVSSFWRILCGKAPFFSGFCSAPRRIFSCNDDSALFLAMLFCGCGLRIPIQATVLSQSQAQRLGFLLLSYHFSFALVLFCVFFSLVTRALLHAWNHERWGPRGGISSPCSGPGLIRRLLCM